MKTMREVGEVVGRPGAPLTSLQVIASTIDPGFTVAISQAIKVGDVNNGVHPVGLSLGPIPIDGPDTPVIFNFQIVNNGHSSVETEIGTLIDSAKNLADKYSAETNIWGLVLKGALTFAGWFFADCDGAVAVDQVALTEAVLKEWTAETGSYSAPEKYYPGSDSAEGCGSNSEYYATWSVHRSFPADA